MPQAIEKILIVGAGPAGLTAACEAQRAGMIVTVLEKDPAYVGGLARTVRYKGHRFDIGGHRFFSKSREITEWWRNRLPDDFVRVKRLSRIFYRRKYFDYPLKPWNALGGLGFFTSVACVCSYILAQLLPRRPEKSFEDWIVNRFGRKLFSIFFQTYTVKVWGIPTSELSADWAAQRIKGLSLARAIFNAFRGAPSASGAVIKTLVDSFDYPRLGPGQMWEKAASDINAAGGRVELGLQVVKISHRNNHVTAVECLDVNGQRHQIEADQFILSMPLKETVLAFDPPLPPSVQAAAQRLSYRDFLIVTLVVEGPNPFPDNWLYIHDSGVKVARIQNFGNWSTAMVDGIGVTCLGLEYFCFEGDNLWTMTDAELIELGTAELKQLDIVGDGRITDGSVVRMEKAYPVYDSGYKANVATIRETLAQFQNLQVIGRNGMHKYNNQDHSMMTAIMAVKNLQGGAFNLWNVNSDAEYHEEETREDASGRQVPRRLG